MKKSLSDPNILEAVDNLSSMAEIDVEELEVEKKSQDEGRDIQLRTTRWLDMRDEQKTLDSVKGTFRALHKYLQHVHKKEGAHLKDAGVQKGVKSIISLANEAAAKFDQCSHLFKKVKVPASITESDEFKQLIEFYQKKVLKKFEEVLQEEEEWQKEWGEEESDPLDIRRRGLRNLETVTRDKNYELFHIAKEDGDRFFNKNLVRHIRLVADFDMIIGELSGDDPLLKIKTLQDREAQHSAVTLRERVERRIDDWIKGVRRNKEYPLVKPLYKAVMALLLAGNRRNLLTHTLGKSSIGYFHDFQVYLREVLDGADYQRLVANPPEDKDKFFEKMISLIHSLCFHLFTHQIDQREALAFFTRIIERESKKKTKKVDGSSSLTLWNRILDDHEAIHEELSKYPNGPLFKILDILHTMEQEKPMFDPLMQESRPSALYRFIWHKARTLCLRLPCPTKQEIINKAVIIEEFKGFLRQLAQAKTKENLLVINFQDRTTWQEFARSQALEEFQKNAEFEKQLSVCTLPKSTDFYLQSADYIRSENAQEFKKLIIEQIISSSECGFYFPLKASHEEMIEFTKGAVEVIHENFFTNKENFSRKNRLDFIEIFYHLLTLKLIMRFSPTMLGFTCKDGVDVSSMAAAGFFAFCKMLSKDHSWKDGEMDLMISMMFIPAFLVRERVVDLQRLSRMVSMLAIFAAELQVNRKKVIKSLSSLFGEDLFTDMRVEEEK